MRIESFWANGYGSLIDFSIDLDRPVTVLCGPNGAGKSSILNGIRDLFWLLGEFVNGAGDDLSVEVPLNVPMEESFVLGANIRGDHWTAVVEVAVAAPWSLRVSEFEWSGAESAVDLMSELASICSMIRADRRPDWRDPPHPDVEVDMDAVVEILVDHGIEPFPSERVFQVMATIVNSGSPLVLVDTPESGLHVPTSGYALRAALSGSLGSVFDQLVVATHSGMFTLDPGGYMEVRRCPHHGTVATRAEYRLLGDVSRHLYEPGPTRYALAHALSHMGEEVVFYRPDGSSVSTSEMIVMLNTGHRLAMKFLEAVHAAAVRSVVLDAGVEDE